MCFFRGIALPHDRAIHTWPVSVPWDGALFFAIVERLLLPVVIDYYLRQELVIF